MADLHIELFGTFRLSRNGTALASSSPKKAKAMLAYLAHEPGKQVNREILAEFLWPDRFDKQAQQSLRQALSAVRKLLGDDGDEILISENGFLSLNPERVTTDIADFETRAASLVPDDMAVATALYTGDFLANLGTISPEFDHWAQVERTRLKALAPPLFEHLATSLDERGLTAQAIEIANRLIEIDPAHEAGHRQLMRLYLSQGQNSAAFRQFETCRLALAKSLDAAPDAETLALLEEIRSHEDGTEPASGGPAVSPATAPQVMSIEKATVRDETSLQDLEGVTKTKWQIRALGAATVLLAGFLIFGFGLQEFIKPDLPDEVASIDETANTCVALQQVASSDEPVLLILPMRSFGDNEFVDFFAHSATDAILSLSSSIPGVTVLAGPFLGHPDEKLTARDLATKNAASHVFDTTIRADTDGQRVTMRIIEGKTGKQIWQTVFTSTDLANAPGRIQNEIAIRAARGIQEHLTDGSQALYFADIKPESLTAFEHIMRGFGYLSVIQPIYNDLARKEFEAVLKVEPDNPSANTGMGFHYMSPLLFRWPGADLANLEKATRHASASVDANPDYAPAKNLQAIALLFEGQHDLALQKMEEGLRLSGSGADSTAIAAYVLSFTDQTERSLEMATRAMRLRPYTSPPWYQWSFARSLRISGNAKGAITCLREIDYQAQGVIAPALELIQAYEEAGMRGESTPLVDLILARTNGSFSTTQYCRSPTYQLEDMTMACIASLTQAGLPE